MTSADTKYHQTKQCTVESRRQAVVEAEGALDFGLEYDSTL